MPAKTITVLKSIRFKVRSSGKVEVVPVKSSDGSIKPIVNKWGVENGTEQLQKGNSQESKASIIADAPC
ncbi:hypothetical protein [Microcoleus sp. FACHB-672]|uniref:hypothetical protein n=1 Tax=Microcoleus sp. FACHB-672 TaxID=2692825 RepID=UPI00168504CA|nr:hypothetical protein [Microcoleus sp. FACHB-672]MBD2040900.1 hypothetical protein [Microcoleus sp. FACHB-672]